MLDEHKMAKDVHDLLVRLGLKRPRYRLDVCPGVDDLFDPGTYERMLPCYAPQTALCPTLQSRQVARCDGVLVDTADKKVVMSLEFELTTKPKDLAGNYFSVFAAATYGPKTEAAVYAFDKAMSAHVLMACLKERRGPTPNEQAKVQQYAMLAEKYQAMGAVLIRHDPSCRLKEARFFHGDDWGRMLAEFERYAVGNFPYLFDTPAGPPAPEGALPALVPDGVA